MTRHIHFLFICNANMNRSATGEHAARSLGFAADSVGSRPDLLFGRPLTVDSINQTQRIVCMEACHRDAVLKIAPDRTSDIDVLDIPDVYYYGHPKLLAQLIAYCRQFSIKSGDSCPS